MFESLTPGSVVGRYRVEGVIGSGGMGVVHAARDEHLNRRVALKVMSGHLAEDPTFRARFLREATVLGRLDSPHIVEVYDHGEQNGHLWIATQLVEGGDLGQLIAHNGPLPAALAIRLCTQVADALQDAHSRGVVHRDVKPANILVSSPGSAEQHAYLTDFGLAREIGADLTAVRGATGTWDYLAPECGSGQQATPASDVYAVGCLLWTCLTGHPPYDGTEIEVALAHARQAPPTLRPGRGLTAPLARRLNAVIGRAMSKDPLQRQGSAAELASELRAAGTGLLAAAGQPGRTPGRRRGLLIGGVVALVAVLGAAIGIKALTSDDAPADATSDERSTAPPADEAAEPVDRPITGDVDGDGFGDLIVSHLADVGQDVELLRSSDGTTLGEPQPWAEEVGVPLRGDVDGDEKFDLLSVETAPGADLEYRISVLRDRVDGVQSTDLAAPRGSSSLYPALGDFDGDGNDDLALASDGSVTGSQGIWVSLSTGDGFAEFTQWYTSDTEVPRPLPGDFDGDGDDDLALLDGADSLGLLVSNGSQLTATTPQGLAQASGLLAPGDFDGDGTDELVGVPSTGTGSGLVVWTYADEQWEDDVRGTLQADTFVSSIKAPSVADFDGDRRDDVLLFSGEYDAPSYDFKVALSSGLAFETEESWREYAHGVEDYPHSVGPAPTE
ncbi:MULTISPECIES: serine/threonine-protein kinase [unclassified Nocardioides]|uniref:serine/threonine-protein kinase n=1 Tax=unclassified Nocardioides TaxID=2615069 RepID=UPI0006F3C1F8|nr:MULTISPECIES: serine/threonine-protein kinase [unclassified Nocardioides]KQY57064.1 hypothetical protein ASD30_12440 [Nocardioides sp. Root140]KRF11704.1 hypothetical protein ASH02_17085 [Nocardioides sp. Soil796]